ncbi:hypothetical protein BVRB_6g136180 [Beta vulgaris subsp. vulgaris]|nr:hypothetical protein BVRB_6g136180 [Beta vulgaris subsp. vulgaris]
MSITGNANYKKPSHGRRHDSGELDVFEAARYFSGHNDSYTNLASANLTQEVVSREERKGYMREGRASLDVPSIKHYFLHRNNHHPMVDAHNKQQQQQQQQQQKTKEKKKHKQPSSPGGKIAQFLNSLFNQTNSKKKKNSSKCLSTQLMKDEDESPISRRKRRSSISHFRSTNSAVDVRSIYSTSSSGFRTPPPYNLNTPTKSCKDFKNFSDYKDVLASLSKYKIQGNGNNNGNPKDEKSEGLDNFDWIDEKLRLKNEVFEKSKILNHGYHQEKVEKCKKYNDHEDEDDGAESDSSSDLFELQIDYEFGFCSSGLPVYETTHMDNIKRTSATTITNNLIKA